MCVSTTIWLVVIGLDIFKVVTPSLKSNSRELMWHCGEKTCGSWLEENVSSTIAFSNLSHLCGCTLITVVLSNQMQSCGRASLGWCSFDDFSEPIFNISWNFYTVIVIVDQKFTISYWKYYFKEQEWNGNRWTWQIILVHPWISCHFNIMCSFCLIPQLYLYPSGKGFKSIGSKLTIREKI